MGGGQPEGKSEQAATSTGLSEKCRQFCVDGLSTRKREVAEGGKGVSAAHLVNMKKSFIFIAFIISDR